jgi:hypothetical protein
LAERLNAADLKSVSPQGLGGSNPSPSASAFQSQSITFRNRSKRLAAVVLALAPGCVLAAPELALPIACDIGGSCIVQNYVDRDPGPAARDYHCGFLSYDGHKGTDIRVIDRARYRQGVPVLAAAAGRVRAVRDGMADGERVAGREAGNSVVIQHGDGWETQYAHLRRGSVAVRSGDRVEAGARVGIVGLSGQTEFAHLHFEVRHDGRTVDPFDAEARADCGAAARSLWDERTRALLNYSASGVLSAGLAGGPPVVTDRDVDTEKTAAFDAAAGAVVFWVHVYGAQAGDVEELRLIGPSGALLAQRRARVERTQAQRLVYVGKRRPAGEWPAGDYRGEYLLFRGERREQVVQLSRGARLETR